MAKLALKRVTKLSLAVAIVVVVSSTGLAQAQGIITTVAGGRALVFRGEGGPATRAGLSRVEAVAVHRSGEIYAGDIFNNLVLRVAPDGTLTVVAGNGTCCFSGDGALATNAALNFPQGIAVDRAGNLLIADRENSRIRQVSLDGIIRTVAGNGEKGIVKLTMRRQSYLGDQPRLLRFNKHTSPSSSQRKLGLSAVDGGSLVDDDVQLGTGCEPSRGP